MKPIRTEEPLCPSAQPNMAGAVLFGVVAGTMEVPRVGYLTDPLVVTEDVLELAAPVQPTEVFRFAAPCAGGNCQHFDGTACRLATRTVQLLPAVTASLPLCRIRPACRWWQQEGKAACMRCPQIITEAPCASELHRRAAWPAC
jgi:hypothetical protein